MEWNRSQTIALAAPQCVHCKGIGLKKNTRKAASPCNCVFRAIFRACFIRFRQCVTKEKYQSRPVLEYAARGGARCRWARKDEEYIADFLLVARRHLPASLYQVFNYHFLLGASWEMCCKRLNIDRGTFFSYVYRIEEKLGRVYRELQPYSLYPLDEYFQGRTENAVAVAPKPPARELTAGARLMRQISAPGTWAA